MTIPNPTVEECDHIYNACDGTSSVYIAVSGEPGAYYANVIIDSEHYCQNLETQAGPFPSPEHACQALSHHFDWFMVPGNLNDEGEDIELCSDTLKALATELPL